MSLNQYDQTVSSLFGLTAPAGEVGCEIEVEGTRLPGVARDPDTDNHLAQMRYHWRVENDGSLRAQNPGDLTAEYILREPVPRDKLDTVFDFFDKQWAKAEATSYDSYRTSVHVHLNVSQWPMRRVYSFLTTYFILEELLTDFADGGTKHRVANRFCLRAKDAEFIIQHLQAMLKQNFRSRLDRRTLKYGAVNIAALSQYGSLEFRALRGTTDTKLIRTWINLLLAVKDFSEKFDNPNEIISSFSSEGPEGFLRLVLGSYADILNKTDLHNKLFEGMRLAQDVGFATHWEPYKAPSEKKVSVTESTWAEMPMTFAAPQPRAEGAPIAREAIFRANTTNVSWGRPL